MGEKGQNVNNSALVIRDNVLDANLQLLERQPLSVNIREQVN